MADEEQKKIFSKNLNKYLSLSNKTQKEVADSIHVSPQTFNTWCQGIALPRMGKVQLLADYFSINKSDLIDEKDTFEPGNHYYLNDETREIAQEIFEKPGLRSLFKAARDLPPERLKAHIDFIESLKMQEENNNDEGC